MNRYLIRHLGNHVGNRWADNDPGSGIMWINCPHVFLGGPPYDTSGFDKRLLAWARAGYPDDVLVGVNGANWVLQPDVGCEL